MQRIDYVYGWWLLRACRRNPLVRGTDRLELLIIALGLLVVLISTACAGALGTAVHDARSRVYVAQAQTRHTVTATATKDSTPVWGIDHSTATRVNARWQVNGTEHRDSLNWGHAVKAGDPLTIWVDRTGDRVEAPASISQAGTDAVGVAYAVWQTVTLAVAALVCWGRRRLERRRDSAWDRDIRWLIYGDGGRTNRKP